MSLIGIFVAWPWLALVPGAAFLGLYTLSRRKIAAAAALLWFLYALYEYSMKRRLLCSGECNIRVDLLLLYPVLIVASITAAIAALRARAK